MDHTENEPLTDPQWEASTPEDAASDPSTESEAARASTPEDARQPYDDLALPLTVRCGHLNLTLEELRQLDVGAIVTVRGAKPGMASLYHGERALAHGELVDVEGELALQITRMELGE